MREKKNVGGEKNAALPRNEASLRVLDGCCWRIYVYTYTGVYMFIRIHMRIYVCMLC